MKKTKCRNCEDESVLVEENSVKELARSESDGAKGVFTIGDGRVNVCAGPVGFLDDV
jgi:hypothetical protein